MRHGTGSAQRHRGNRGDSSRDMEQSRGWGNPRETTRYRPEEDDTKTTSAFIDDDLDSIQSIRCRDSARYLNY